MRQRVGEIAVKPYRPLADRPTRKTQDICIIAAPLIKFGFFDADF